MFRLLPVWMILCIGLAGCATTNEVDPPAEAGTDGNEGMLQEEEVEKQPNEDLLIDSREEINGEDDRITTAEAEELVREHLQIDEGSHTVVAYNSNLEDGRYLIRVNTMKDNTTDEDRATNDGWYAVNATSGEVQRYNK